MYVKEVLHNINSCNIVGFWCTYQADHSCLCYNCYMLCIANFLSLKTFAIAMQN